MYLPDTVRVDHEWMEIYVKDGNGRCRKAQHSFILALAAQVQATLDRRMDGMQEMLRWIAVDA